MQFRKQGDDAKWYSSGLAFECQGCGGCCAGPEEGYVWVTEDDVQAIAAHLRISVREMMVKYVRLVGKRMSLREDPGSKDCLFLKAGRDGQRKCSIYSCRPTQCLTWPFWPSNLRRQDDWSIAATRCVGINRGNLHNLDQIETRSDATNE